jgi:hypothetical protein
MAPLFKEINVQPVPLLVKYSFINIVHRHHYNKLPSGLSHIWSIVRSRLDIAGAPTLRNENNYLCPFARTEHLSRFPLNQSPELWTELPDHLKNISNFYTFSLSLKSHLLNSLTTNCTRLFYPACSQISSD